MLVYHKEPMGYTSVDGRRVYGRNFAYGRFGPTEISYKVFKKNKEILEEVPITHKWLTERFKKEFPPVSFKFSEIWKLEFDKLIEIAELLGIEYRRSRKSTDLERRALRKVVMRIIDGEQ